MPEGDNMARQTAQAKLLREARDELAAIVAKLAEKKNRVKLVAIGIPQERAENIVTLPSYAGGAFNTEDMAKMLGASTKTLRNWLAEPGSGIYRPMPEMARMLLQLRLEKARDILKAR